MSPRGSMRRAEAAVIARAAKAARAPSLDERFWSKVERRGADECWPWKACARKKSEGYGAFWIGGRHQPASRMAAILSGKPVPEGAEVCHSCDWPPCCNPSHLFVASRQANNADKVAKRRHCFGERNGIAKLTEAQVMEIRTRRPSSPAPRGFKDELAKHYKITKRTVDAIWGGQRWTHVT